MSQYSQTVRTAWITARCLVPAVLVGGGLGAIFQRVPVSGLLAVIIVSVAADGRYTVNRTPVDGRSVELLAAELASAAGGSSDMVVIVSADATAAHQSVINVMDAARRANLPHLTFATQTSAGAEAR